jgi:hypothetical protein
MYLLIFAGCINLGERDFSWGGGDVMWYVKKGPASANKEYNVNLGENVENGFLLNLEMIVMGDINYDFLNTTTYYKRDLIKTFGTCNLKQIVDDITRPVSGTCLDHIYSTHSERMYNCTTINVGLSDHLPVLAVRRYKRPQREHFSNGEKHLTFEYRNIKKMDKEAFISDLRDAPWDAAFVFDDVDEIVDTLYDIFNGILDKHAPLPTALHASVICLCVNHFVFLFVNYIFIFRIENTFVAFVCHEIFGNFFRHSEIFGPHTPNHTC